MNTTGKSLFPVTPSKDVNALPFRSSGEPSLWEVLLMLGTMLAIHLLAVCRVRGFWELPDAWFDRADYLKLASIIRHWHYSNGPIPKFFWGFPYAIAGTSRVFSIPGPMAVVLISMLGSLAVCVLLHRLYGGWVAAIFIFINYQWIMLSLEGGSEPLFMCLLYASFLAARSSRWNCAALLASLSTTVRPVGIFALVGFAAALVIRRCYRQLAAIAGIGLVIGVTYVIPLWIILGNPFANFVGYRAHWGPHGWPLTYPFGALIPSYLSAFHEGRWTFFVFSAAWLVVALVGIVAMALPKNRPRLWSYQPENLFAWMYTMFFLVYNDLDISLAFDRYLLPVLPLLLFAMADWIPRDRRVLWGAAVVSALFSAAAVVSFRNVFGFKLP